jgi:glycosyltransferase involved in cell wall biosynthesis
VLPGMSPGGMESIVIQLAADATRHRDAVIVASAPGPWVGRVTESGTTHLALPVTGRGAGAVLAAGEAIAVLMTCISKFRPHVIHSHNVRATAMARIAATCSPAWPVLLPTLHGLAPADYPAASRVLRRTTRRVIACGPSVAGSLRTAGFPGDRIDVIRNGARLAPAGPERLARLRAALQLGSAPLVVGIGRLVEQKGWPVLITAAAGLHGPVFAVAGDGPLRQSLTDLAGRSGARVRFLGPVDDVAALVGLASCVVCTSSWEGLPLALLEALSLGAPVVATAVDGIADLVPPGAAVLVPPGDPAAVAAAIERVLADQNLAACLRANALAAAACWTPEAMLDSYRTAYLAALAGEPRWA